VVIFKELRIKVKYFYVVFEVLKVVTAKSFLFRGITPCSLVRFNQCFGGFLKTEAIWSSETMADFHWITQCYISENRTLQNTFSLDSLYNLTLL
jgi:hypothetical protein